MDITHARDNTPRRRVSGQASLLAVVLFASAHPRPPFLWSSRVTCEELLPPPSPTPFFPVPVLSGQVCNLALTLTCSLCPSSRSGLWRKKYRVLLGFGCFTVSMDWVVVPVFLAVL